MPAKPPGYWNDFANLERELLAFVAEHGKAGVMPTHTMLLSAGRGDLSHAMHQHGGIMAVAQRLGLVYDSRCKPPRYWQDLAVIDSELLAFIAAHGEPGVMPKKKALEAAGRGDLVNAIARAGGQYATAQRLGLRPADTRRAHNHWADVAELDRELQAFVAEPSRSQRMPSLRELIAARRFDLHYAVQRHGGVSAMAERLGWPTASARTGQAPEPGSGG
jgi:ribosomal protein L13E